MQGPGGRDPQAVLHETEKRRKGIQAVHMGEFETAIEPARTKLLELEGQDMRDAIQEKARCLTQEALLNLWHIAHCTTTLQQLLIHHVLISMRQHANSCLRTADSAGPAVLCIWLVKAGTECQQLHPLPLLLQSCNTY